MHRSEEGVAQGFNESSLGANVKNIDKAMKQEKYSKDSFAVSLTFTYKYCLYFFIILAYQIK